ncbi:uncharacterized protein LOC126378279 [Pectinophora gossypiella]|uniref:uncharacterized protein LOC126378279 n=1 Tax=Pectinophora gossypiella TaxID=13191 RepID=UPI00214E2249|nr:uncharacterized protein LOC126378279 [Pectinophora gossypiella]
MAHCCSQCSFTAQFESALAMHCQLHHESPADKVPDCLPDFLARKSNSMPRDSSPASTISRKQNKGIKLPGRTSSATKLFCKLRSRICRSKTLFSHPEETADQTLNDLTAQSECTSKALKMESVSRTSALTPCLRELQRETYACHLCAFDADRITVLDRHLLNDHKIGLENLLKLVLAKTKDGLADDSPADLFGIRQPYYKPSEDIVEDDEFVIETVTPKIKILKHTATNTDILWQDSFDEVNNAISELEKNDLLEKMQTLNECMCKFVDSSNTLKKVLSKEFDGKHGARKDTMSDEPHFDLGLSNTETPRDWERAHSEKLERNRSKQGDRYSEKSKLSSAESYYF